MHVRCASCDRRLTSGDLIYHRCPPAAPTALEGAVANDDRSRTYRITLDLTIAPSAENEREEPVDAREAAEQLDTALRNYCKQGTPDDAGLQLSWHVAEVQLKREK